MGRFADAAISGCIGFVPKELPAVPKAVQPTRILGIDLAWGERNGDGLCLIETTARRSLVTRVDHVFGDEALVEWISAHVGEGPALLLFDAPVVCPNSTGGRPVDRETHRLFGQQHAGCHPANSTLCPRPARVAAKLARLGFRIGWEPARGSRLIAEVYPHPALVRFLGLDRIIKYKRGTKAEKAFEFRRLQTLLRDFVAREWPRLELGEVAGLFEAPWTKPTEDKLDAFICGLIGLNHWHHRGRRSQVLGGLETGFILLPAETKRAATPVAAQ